MSSPLIVLGIPKKWCLNLTTCLVIGKKEIAILITCNLQKQQDIALVKKQRKNRVFAKIIADLLRILRFDLFKIETWKSVQITFWHICFFKLLP